MPDPGIGPAAAHKDIHILIPDEDEPHQVTGTGHASFCPKVIDFDLANASVIHNGL